MEIWSLSDSAIPSVTHLSSGSHPLSSNCFHHARFLSVLCHQQPPGPFLRRLSPTSQVLWPRLTSAGSAMPSDMGYILRCVPRFPPRIRCNRLHSMQPPHLRDISPGSMGLRLVRQPRPFCPALYAIPVRRLGNLPPASFRFHLTVDTLAFS